MLEGIPMALCLTSFGSDNLFLQFLNPLSIDINP